MLKHLLIENYALIEQLDISFEDGFTVITGETGAGKSILLGALSLLLGQRADTRVLMHKEKKCIIEGTFDVKNVPLKDLFEKYQLDYDDLCIFRREINSMGKSRAFINDTPVNLSIVTLIAAQLVDIHSQHQNLLLGEASFQTEVLDNFASNYKDVLNYRKKYKELCHKKSELEELLQKEKKSRTDLDYFRFQFEELDQAKLNPEEFSEMESELEIMQNAGEINANLEKSSWLLDQGENNFIEGLNRIIQLINPLARYGEQYRELQQRLGSVLIETRDISVEMNSLASEIIYDAGRVNYLTQRVDLINRLMLKHNVSDVEELQAVRDEYQARLQDIDSMEDLINQKTKETQLLEKELFGLAAEISVKRSKVIPALEKQITGLLQQLGMPAAIFQVKLFVKDSLSLNGIDEIQFFFNANAGGELNEISRVASGGELSRVMLAVKSVISQKNILPTIIFDEIDTGISGETATRVANILQSISRNMQVITITHLPQIASRGNTHLLVNKSVENGRTKTVIKKADNNERVAEIATMLGGEKPSKTMKQTAEELISNGKRTSL